jgi:capsular exopolysaccharide synthesis family protein
MAGVGLALGVEYLDSSVKIPEDVWRAVGLPTLGVVPHLSSLPQRLYLHSRLFMRFRQAAHPTPTLMGDLASSPTLPVLQHPFSAIAESYRTIRTALLLSQVEKPPQVILLTSANPADGKTVTTLNLAVTLAQSGRMVVLIDADLRRGNCHRLLHMPNLPGLTNVLTTSMTVEEAVQRSEVEGLSFLSRGTVPPDPAHLLGSEKMKNVLETLRQQFDFVLLDSPPLIGVSDAAVLSTFCDGVLLVLRSQRTTIEAARRAMDHLEAIQARLLGVVLNDIDLGSPYFSDYRHYYKSYYADQRNAARD